jgi:hypothetical protein
MQQRQNHYRTGEGEMQDRERIIRQREALEAVLLFYGPSPWTGEAATRWFEITGSGEVTTKVLCDHIRSVLGEPE